MSCCRPAVACSQVPLRRCVRCCSASACCPSPCCSESRYRQVSGSCRLNRRASQRPGPSTASTRSAAASSPSAWHCCTVSRRRCCSRSPVTQWCCSAVSGCEQPPEVRQRLGIQSRTTEPARLQVLDTEQVQRDIAGSKSSEHQRGSWPGCCLPAQYAAPGRTR